MTPASRDFLRGLICLSLTMGLSIGYVRVITALYAVELEAHGWMLAAVGLSQSIGMLALASSAGRWVDTHGARPVFLTGSIWGLLICLLTPLAPAFPALLLFTAAGSLAMPPRFVSINTLFMSRLQELGEARVGWFRAAHVIGMTFLGAVLATSLFPVYGALPAFWFAAAIFALNILVFLRGVGRHMPPRAPVLRSPAPGTLAQLARSTQARQVAFWEFSIQSLSAYFAFYIVVIVLRYLHLPEHAAGLAVAAQGVVFVGTLVAAGRWVTRFPQGSRAVGGVLVLLALWRLSTAQQELQVYLGAASLGGGLGLLQTINLAAFAELGRRIGFSQAAAINALSGPCGGVLGGVLGGLLEPWVTPQHLFPVFAPLIGWLALRPAWAPAARSVP